MDRVHNTTAMDLWWTWDSQTSPCFLWHEEKDLCDLFQNVKEYSSFYTAKRDLKVGGIRQMNHVSEVRDQNILRWLVKY